MKLLQISPLLLALFFALAGCSEDPEPSPPPIPRAPAIDPLRGHLLEAQPRLPAITVKIGTNELIAEVAQTAVQIATGMMFRTNMLENEAMLFVFPNAAPRSFYMRNCFIPLSGAYISPSGEILQIIEMKPHDERGLPSYSDDVQFVLETPHGWFERHGVNIGARVVTERGSLKETFFPQR